MSSNTEADTITIIIHTIPLPTFRSPRNGSPLVLRTLLKFSHITSSTAFTATATVTRRYTSATRVRYTSAASPCVNAKGTNARNTSGEMKCEQCCNVRRRVISRPISLLPMNGSLEATASTRRRSPQPTSSEIATITATYTNSCATPLLPSPKGSRTLPIPEISQEAISCDGIRLNTIIAPFNYYVTPSSGRHRHSPRRPKPGKKHGRTHRKQKKLKIF
ncbi:hypothetical protein [uncultured Duncaniella sp.]|uniref:hypothetical protein n=1 Tax=uncultured Duncaniella sp. TaxID=2768039 RepID=UPI00261B5703|nr:hypothetical protein [uncultured Duncaniella sp.]